MDNKWPRWRYHEEKKPDGKIVHSAEENEALGLGWVDSPAEFGKTEKQDEGVSPALEQETLSGDEMKVELDKADLVQILIKRGHKRRDLKNLSRDELLRMAEGAA